MSRSRSREQAARRDSAVRWLTSYPGHPDGEPVSWEDCWPVGEAAHGAGLDGVACRSAAEGAGRDDHELAYFERDNAPALEPVERLAFSDWFWARA